MVNGLFDSRNDLSVFKNHIRDFLVQSKEFSAQVCLLCCILCFIIKKKEGRLPIFARFIVAINIFLSFMMSILSKRE